MQDVGTYECIASNYLGSASHRARLNQLGPPLVKPMYNATALQGRPYTLNCTYGGYPLEEVYFVKGLSSSGKGQRMPFDERHLLLGGLGSITINPVEVVDEDWYRCVVVTANGEKAEQKFYLKVALGPVVSPIIFSDNLAEGMRGSAVCTVTSGDAPIQIAWYKDGIRLPEHQHQRSHSPVFKGNGASSSSASHQQHHPGHHRTSNIEPVSTIDFVLAQMQIVPIQDFMSSLLISNISRHHQGTYTCAATSPVASANVSAFLTVRALPQWRLKPRDHRALADRPLTLDCQASGQPPPVIRWKFVAGVGAGQVPATDQAMPILSSQTIHVLENGSLHIRSLEPKHSGYYLCDASNSVNKVPVEAGARVDVLSLPRVSIQNLLNGGSGGQVSTVASSDTNYGPYGAMTNHGHSTPRLVMAKSSQFQLMCSSHGIASPSSESPMSVEWLSPEKAQENQVIREESKSNEKRSYLYISHLTRYDSGLYACLATNNAGQSLASVELLVQEVPDAPSQVRAEEVASRAVVLTWSLEHDGNAPINVYLVEYWQKVDTDPSLDTNDIASPNMADRKDGDGGNKSKIGKIPFLYSDSQNGSQT